MDPRDLLKRTADVYRAANTYRDRGRARHRRIAGTHSSEERQRFATYLDRRQGFRLDLVRPSSTRPLLVWPSPEPGRSPIPNRGQVELMTALFKLHLHGPAGCFGVPSLLLPEEFKGSLLGDLEDPQYRGRALLGSHPCHRVFGRWKDRTEVLLWLDEDRFLVRQWVDRTEYRSGQEAAALREKHLRRRDQALAAGIARPLVEDAFGQDRLLALPHWPYAVPREDWRTVTRVSYEPELGGPIEENLFRCRA